MGFSAGKSRQTNFLVRILIVPVVVELHCTSAVSQLAPVRSNSQLEAYAHGLFEDVRRLD